MHWVKKIDKGLNKQCCVSFSLRFGNDLQISEKLFVLDAGASGSKDMKLLRNHLQEIRSQIVSVSNINGRVCASQNVIT